MSFSNGTIHVVRIDGNRVKHLHKVTLLKGQRYKKTILCFILHLYDFLSVSTRSPGFPMAPVSL